MYVFDVIKKKSFHATKENKIEKTKIYRLKDVEILETNLRENRFTFRCPASHFYYQYLCPFVFI